MDMKYGIQPTEDKHYNSIRDFNLWIVQLKKPFHWKVTDDFIPTSGNNPDQGLTSLVANARPYKVWAEHWGEEEHRVLQEHQVPKFSGKKLIANICKKFTHI
jgi:hypothetical protein